MDIFFIALLLFVLTVALAIFSNRARVKHEVSFDLHPNCLLTRFPLLFVTGPRSFFYFESYWNGYTSYLAEHGYEVFKLRLPWSNSQLRRQRFIEFIQQQEQMNKKFHVFVDSPTLIELESILRATPSTAIMTLTEISDADEKHPSPANLKAFPFPKSSIESLPSNRGGSLMIQLSYALHRASLTKYSLPSLSTLGVCSDTFLSNSRLLLDRAQTLAEMDLQRE